MVSLNRFDVFRTVVEAGSFSAAAARLNQARAAVSFNIKQLENELGVALFTRTTRRITLTDAGQRFYVRCLRVAEEAQAAIDEARAEHGALSGLLRVTSTVEYALAVVAPALDAFTQRHSCLRVCLETHTAMSDLFSEQVDVAIRLGRFEQFKDLPYRGALLTTYQVRPVLAPSLLDSAGLGADATPADLARLPHLGRASQARIRSWTATDNDGKEHFLQIDAKPRMVADNASVLRLLAKQGCGLALLPDWLVREDLASGTLVDALPAFSFPAQAIYALYRPGSHIPQKVRACVGFLKEYLGVGHGSSTQDVPRDI